MQKNIVVLGSINADIVLTTQRMPKIGETLIGDQIDQMAGGKGANQAISISRAGGRSILLGKYGEDVFGQEIFNYLKKEHVSVDRLVAEENTFTGIANIFKLPDDNSIIIIPGANELVDLNYLKTVQSEIEKADVFLTQLEIPLETVFEGLKVAKKSGSYTILNPAPFSDEIEKMLPYVDCITPNEIEFEGLIKDKVSSLDELEDMMLQWSRKHDTTLVVTRGSDGVSYVDQDKVFHLPAIPADVVDTTGAGDTFNGILALSISEGENLHDAIKHAISGASLSTEKLGAQTGMPSMEEVKKRMNSFFK